jgi:hypothetical protein
MGVRIGSAVAPFTVVVTPNLNTETIVVTTGFIVTPQDNAQILLFWFWQCVPGTTSTAVQARLRRGAAVGSALVNQSVNQLTSAGAGIYMSGCYVDVLAAQGPVQYSLTYQSTAATVNGTVNDYALIAMVL